MSKFHVARGIAAAMLLSLVPYAVVIELVARGVIELPPALEGETAEVVRTVLYGVAIADAVLAVALGRLLRPKPGTADPEGRMLAATIVSLALCEAVALFGVALFFLTRQATTVYPLFALAVALMLAHFPRESRWRDALREAGTATSGPLAP